MVYLDEKYDSVRGIYYGTFTATRAINKISVFSYPQVAGDAKIEWVKLEKGNKPTDWTPAPEDVEAQIALKLDTSIFNSHVSNNDINVKHLTDAQLNYLNNLISWWKIDANGNLYTEKNLYSTLEVSAYGAGTGSEGNGGATILDDLTDVTIVNPLNNQFLVYNFSTKQWENQTISFTPTSHSPSLS